MLKVGFRGGKLFIGSAALILGGGLLANKQGWVGSAEGDDEPKEDESMITDNEPTLVENPNTGDLLRVIMRKWLSKAPDMLFL